MRESATSEYKCTSIVDSSSTLAEDRGMCNLFFDIIQNTGLGIHGYVYESTSVLVLCMHFPHISAQISSAQDMENGKTMTRDS